MSPIMLMMPSICSASRTSSGRWSLISANVRKPRSLPSTIRLFRRRLRASTSAGRQHARRDLGVPAVLALAARVFGALAGDLCGDLARGRLVARRVRRRRRRPSRPWRRRPATGLAAILGGRLDVAGDRLRGRMRLGLGQRLRDLGFRRRLPGERLLLRRRLGLSPSAAPPASSPSAARPSSASPSCGPASRACAPSPPAALRAGLRGFAFAGDLRAGFAGFLAMVILGDRVPFAPISGRTGKPQILSCR